AVYELRQHVARDIALAALELQALEVRERLTDRVRAEIRDRVAAEIDGLGLTVQAPAFAACADLRLGVVGAVSGAAAAAPAARRAFCGRASVRAVGEPRLVVLVLVGYGREPGSVARLAPAAPRVIREHPRVERLEAAPAARACSLGRVELAGARASVAVAASIRRHDAYHSAA